MTTERITENEEKIISELKLTGRDGIEDLIAWMKENEFFVAPCSSKYHLCCPGGLAQHSLNVLEWTRELAATFQLGAEVPDSSLIIVALLHDLGKAGQFGKSNYVENILKSGKQSEAEPYKTNKDLLYIPHEARSLIIAERFINLTEEEEHAIYYHNGKYTHIGYDLKETPLMMLLHFSDLWCSRVIEEGGDD